jgi:hypothetical protein
MTRTSLLATAAATLILLSGCGSDAATPAASPEPSETTSQPTTPAATAAPTTPATTPTTVPTTKAPAPAGKLINYETGDEQGVVLTTDADADRLTGAPADFKAFVIAELATADPGEGCTERPQLYVSRLDTGGWARGGYFVPQCGGYAALWAKAGGSWKEVWSGQSLVECTTLTQYKIPSRIAGDSCLDGDTTVDYSA